MTNLQIETKLDKLLKQIEVTKDKTTLRQLLDETNELYEKLDNQ